MSQHFPLMPPTATSASKVWKLPSTCWHWTLPSSIWFYTFALFPCCCYIFLLFYYLILLNIKCKQWAQSKHAESLEGQTREAGMPHLNASFLPLNIIDNEKHHNPFVVLVGWLVGWSLFVCLLSSVLDADQHQNIHVVAQVWVLSELLLYFYY